MKGWCAMIAADLTVATPELMRTNERSVFMLRLARGACAVTASAALALFAGCATTHNGPPADTSSEQASTGAAQAWQRVHLSHDGVSYDFPVYANRPLDGDLSSIEQIVIVQHGIDRDGDTYFAAGESIMRAIHADPNKVLLVAPDFPAAQDSAKGFGDDLPMWNAGGETNWAEGAVSIDPLHVSSMQVYDDLLRQLTDRARTPALKRLVVAGHSAGAQLVQRYAVLNNLDGTLRSAGIDVHYVVANPSSYLYFTNERPDGTTFAVPAHLQCVGYDDYRYGMQNIVPYGEGHDGVDLFRRYAARKITYLLGSADDNPHHPDLDRHCGAEAEGPTRLERGRLYLRYERYLAGKVGGGTLGLDHDAYEVIDVGHHANLMFASRCGTQVLFGTTNIYGAQCRAPQP
jgi:pimeloyl-ACP methyl ester carboxylesterase